MANGTITTRIIGESSFGRLISDKLDEDFSIEFTRENFEEYWLSLYWIDSDHD